MLSYGLYVARACSPQHPILAIRQTALTGVLLADIWQWTPFMVLIMLAGLRALPKEPYEAAAIDGATAMQAFFKLTLPMIAKIIAIAVLIRGVDLFRIYDYVKVMTDGGPGTATETLTSYAGAIYFRSRLPLRLDLRAAHAHRAGHRRRTSSSGCSRCGSDGARVCASDLRDIAAVLVVAALHVPARLVGADLDQAQLGDLQQGRIVYLRLRADARSITPSRCSAVALGSSRRASATLRRRRRQLLRFAPDDHRHRRSSRSARPR